MNDDSANTAARIEGQWKCDERSSIYNKSTLEIYTVYITIHHADSSKILIDNFYKLGENVQVEAAINRMKLTIPSQTTFDGYIVKGEGTVNKNYDEINWTYTVDDGSGQTDQVTAVYTRGF